MGGAGGGQRYYPTEAVLLFRDEDGIPHAINKTVYLSDPSHGQDLDSLLGRDALSDFVMTFNQTAQSLELNLV